MAYKLLDSVKQRCHCINSHQLVVDVLYDGKVRDGISTTDNDNETLNEGVGT